jgi:hypothetical protein
MGTKLTLNLSKMLQNHVQKMFAGAIWVRSDGLAMANLDATKLSLRFESLAAIQHEEEIKRVNEEKQRATVPQF